MLGCCKGGGTPSLTKEPCPDHLIVRAVKKGKFQRHPSLQERVPGQVDHPHAALAELLLQAIAAKQFSWKRLAGGLLYLPRDGWTGFSGIGGLA